MIVGILKEIKTEENRVAMTPGGVELMKQHGHTILVESKAGVSSGFEDCRVYRTRRGNRTATRRRFTPGRK